MSLGQQYKISPLETEPPLTLLLTSPILSLGLFPVTLLDLPDMLAQTEEWGWLDRSPPPPPTLTVTPTCASVGFGCAEALAPAGVREEDRLTVAGVCLVVSRLKDSGAAWHWWLEGSPRFHLMAPLGPTHC